MFTPPVVPPLDIAALPDALRGLIRTATPITMGFSGDGVYNCGEYILKTSKHVERLTREHDSLRWLQGRLPVSEVMWFGTHPDAACGDATPPIAYLLTSKLAGCMAHESGLPSLDITAALAEGLELLNAVDISDCPFNSRLDVLLKHARELVEAGAVSMNDWERDTPFSSPEELLAWLEANRPADELLSFVHRDFCLPNIFIKDGRVSGFCDVGSAGIGDRWFDLALCVRSMGYNRVDDDGNVEWLFKRLALPFDKERIRYYILLDELF